MSEQISEEAWKLAYRKKMKIRYPGVGYQSTIVDKLLKDTPRRSPSVKRMAGSHEEITSEEALAAQAELDAASEIGDAQVEVMARVIHDYFYGKLTEAYRWDNPRTSDRKKSLIRAEARKVLEAARGAK